MFNVLNDWVEKLYPDLDIASIVKTSKQNLEKLNNKDGSNNDMEKVDDQKEERMDKMI